MPQMIRCALTLSSALFASLATAGPTVVSADLMVPAEWSQRVVADVGSATIETFVLLESNPSGPPGPDTVWATRMAKPQSNGPNTSTDAVANLLLAPAWNPATQGALAQVDVTLLARGSFTGFLDRTTGFLTAALEQDGTVYTVRNSAVRLTIDAFPTELSWSFDATDDWLSFDGSRQPDFSAAGTPLRVGYRWELQSTCTAARGCEGVSTITLVDRFTASLQGVSQPGGGNTVPEPSLPALVLAALSAVAWCRRTGQRPAA